MPDRTGCRLFEMAREGDMTDVKLKVKGKEIPVHSAVAASRGGTLKELLTEPEEKIALVNIGDDIEPEIFEAVLK